MGKFAVVYDLPAGEEMLVVLCDGICGPAVQYISEINGELEVAEVELCGPEDEALRQGRGARCHPPVHRRGHQGIPAATRQERRFQKNE